MGLPWWPARCVLVGWCCWAVFCGVLGKKDDAPYMSQFSSEIDFKAQDSTPFHGGRFQYLKVSWVRQTQDADNVTIMVGYDALDDVDPQVAWLVNGRLVHESDRSIKQEVTKAWIEIRQRDVRVASITIPRVIAVTSLQLLLVLDTIDSLTDINVQDQEHLEVGHSILEQGSDVALALSSQEDVTFHPGDDVIFLARFFAEELTNAASQSLEARYLRQLPSNPDVTLEIVTPSSNADVMTARQARSDEVPASVQRNFRSALRQHQLVTVREDSQNVRGLVEFTAAYRSTTPCRLFGGQKITRRAFVRARNDTGGYWGRGGPMAFLPFQHSIPVTCWDRLDVSVTAFGELSPYIYLVKDGDILESGDGVTIFTYQRLLQTEAVFRFESITPEMSGTYLVWAENGLGRTDETSFTLVLEEDC